MKAALVIVAAALALPTALQAGERTPVELPPMMQQHMLANMRDHLAALAQAQSLAAEERWDAAAELIENRLGMSSLESHGASHMAHHIPPAMREMGTEMHASASRLSHLLQEADPMPVLGGFGDLVQHCHACHSAFRIR